MTFPSLVPYGWNARWAELLAELPGDVRPARVMRHDGVALFVAAPEGSIIVTLGRRLDPEPTVGDWVVLDAERPIGVLPRASLLRRRSANRDTEQSLAANVDVVLLVCGVDRPIKAGRIQRVATLARDAGSEPVIVLTKTALTAELDTIVHEVREANPGLDVVTTSVKEGLGIDELTALVDGRTVTLLGESGAGKSSILNALMGSETAAVGHVRAGDSKGRHTTTSRELHLLPGGGTLIDTPGIRSVGLWVDPEAVSETFADIDELSEECRFANCGHESEPGCAINTAIEAGTLTIDRLEAWRTLRLEAEALAMKANPYEERRRDKRFTGVPREPQRRKGR